VNEQVNYVRSGKCETSRGFIHLVMVVMGEGEETGARTLCRNNEARPESRGERLAIAEQCRGPMPARSVRLRWVKCRIGYQICGALRVSDGNWQRKTRTLRCVEASI